MLERAKEEYFVGNLKRALCIIRMGRFSVRNASRKTVTSDMQIKTHVVIARTETNATFGYLLLKDLQKVTGAFALRYLEYNIKQAKNMLGFEKMLKKIYVYFHMISEMCIKR